MGLSHAPRVITDGIVLGLDAANTRSYVGSGTTWTDLIGSNNGTLTNGPVFTQEPKLEPFGGAGAVSFDGSGDYLNISSHSDHDLGSGDFTVEGWFKTSATIANQTIIQKYYGPTNNNGWNIALDSAGTGLQVNVFSGSTQGDLFGGSNLNDGAWHHFALSRSGTDLRLFVDGTLTGSTTNSFNITATADLQIGRHFTVSFRDWNGQLSNIRILKGTALYTSNFTPPRKKLEATSDTVLLTCEKGTIRDRSSSAHAITINGDAKSISGASYFEFDGTNHYADLPDSNDFAVGTSGDITIEAWINSNSWTGTGGLVCLYQCGDATGLSIQFASGRLRLQNYSTEFSLGSTTLSTGQWYHIVAVRRGGSLIGYVNGSVENAAISNTVDFSQNGPRIGQWKGLSGYYFDGKISNFKIYKNKGFTAAEVEQNFNALRGRYGI